MVLPLCGGNIDTTILGRCLDRGLACDGRLLKFSVTVSDRPGGIAELCRQMASIGISIKDIMHERAWIQSDIFSVEVTVCMHSVCLIAIHYFPLICVVTLHFLSNPAF